MRDEEQDSVKTLNRIYNVIIFIGVIFSAIALWVILTGG